MLRHYSFPLLLLVLIVTAVGCAGPKVQNANLLANPIQVTSADLAVALLRIYGQVDTKTLTEEYGWREYVIEIENVSTNVLTVQNVKLLRQDGSYVDSASTYEQITAPPDVKYEVTGDIAETAASIAAGQIIPFGGQIFSIFSSAASGSSAQAKAKAKHAFMLRVLKNVELAPGGKVERSAFLPNITKVKLLVVDYAQDGKTYRIEIPLPMQKP
jgi:hypothetical protein